jgi:hypothetical protein
MINKDDVIPIIIESCPSFQDIYNNSDNKELLYVVMGELARHMLDIIMSKDYKRIDDICLAIEEFHVNGDQYVKELATIGILEGIQNVWGNNNREFEINKLTTYLRPVSLNYWNSLNKFWNQEIPYVGYDIKSAQQGDAPEPVSK